MKSDADPLDDSSISDSQHTLLAGSKRGRRVTAAAKLIVAALASALILCSFSRLRECWLLRELFPIVQHVSNCGTAARLLGTLSLLACGYPSLAIVAVIGFCIEVLTEQTSRHTHSEEMLAVFALAFMTMLLTTSLIIKLMRFRDRREREGTDRVLRQEMLREQL